MTPDPLIAPVGHLHGPIDTAVNVRVGTRTVTLGEREYAAWLLAHGVDELGPRLLTAAALGMLVGDPEPLDRLWDDGLLTEVPADPAGYPAFAAAYRLEPLVHGLGNAGSGFGIGLPGERLGRTAELSGAWAELNATGFEFWRRSAACGSLAETVGAVVDGDSVLRDGLRGLTADALRDYAIALLEPLLTGWTAALHPAAPTPPVPGPRGTGSPLPPPEPVDPFTALDPEDVLEIPWHPGRADSLIARSPRWRAEPGHPGAAGWLFAAGHSGGPFHAWSDRAFVAHLVRIGSDDHLLDPGEAALWELTRDADEDRLWTRTSIAAAAVGEGVPDAARRLDALIARGALVEVHPGTERAREFARAYRLRPLLHGLGTGASDRGIFEYGVPGRHRVESSTAHTALLWRTAGQWPSLWDAVVAVSGSYADAGQTALREDTPDEYLTYWGFAGVRELLRSGVVYLDLAP